MSISKRKNQHIKFSGKSQVDKISCDHRFSYEPLLSANRDKERNYRFLGQKLGGPIFISSMTGGSRKGEYINKTLANVAKDFSLPLGLGSIRPYIENRHRESFKVRKSAGWDTLIFGNLGIAQIEQLIERKEVFKLEKAISELELDGLIIHINPLQEWVQEGGDLYRTAPVITLETILPMLKTKIIIKEVGAGFGRKSLKRLMELPVDVIDISAFGGTNFTKMELLRGSKRRLENYKPLINIGHTPDNCVKNINEFINNGIGTEKEFIISGGVRNFLDGYYYNSLLEAPSIYGYAYPLLVKLGKSEKALYNFIEDEIRNYGFSMDYLHLNRDTCIKN